MQPQASRCDYRLIGWVNRELGLVLTMQNKRHSQAPRVRANWSFSIDLARA
jgi:hypothetical protein